jgi:hypothetical protein
MRISWAVDFAADFGIVTDQGQLKGFGPLVVTAVRQGALRPSTCP